MYTESGGTKEQLSVLVTTRGDGKLMPSAIICPYKRAVPREIVEKIPDGFVVAKSDSGWMTSEVFYEYMNTNPVSQENWAHNGPLQGTAGGRWASADCGSHSHCRQFGGDVLLPLEELIRTANGAACLMIGIYTHVKEIVR